jgi:hypothetical protein
MIKLNPLEDCEKRVDSVQQNSARSLAGRQKAITSSGEKRVWSAIALPFLRNNSIRR